MIREFSRTICLRSTSSPSFVRPMRNLSPGLVGSINHCLPSMASALMFRCWSPIDDSHVGAVVLGLDQETSPEGALQFSCILSDDQEQE